MIIETLKTLYSRDLRKLKQEMEAYKSEEKIWYVQDAISNSAGNLCLHLVGNLNAYIGAEFGKTGYIRDRDAEFSLKNIPRTELISKIEGTMDMIEKSLPMITTEQLNTKYPQEIFDKNATTEEFLVHLAMHLSYHLGQINYHRRLLDS